MKIVSILFKIWNSNTTQDTIKHVFCCWFYSVIAFGDTKNKPRIKKKLSQSPFTCRIGCVMYYALPSPRYLDTFVASRSEVSRADVRSQSPVLMLPNKSEDEPMVTKKKSKIPCLSLSSFLPALEGTVQFVWPLFTWPRRHRLRSLVLLHSLSCLGQV